MVSNFFQTSILLLLLNTFTPSLAEPVVSSGQVNKICSKTVNPSFCESVINNIHGVSSSNFAELVNVVVYAGYVNATSTLSLIDYLIPKAKGRLKESYTTCSKYYEDVVDHFSAATMDVITSNNFGLCVEALDASYKVGDCKDDLEGLSPDPAVIKGVKDLQSLCNITMVLARFHPL